MVTSLPCSLLRRLTVGSGSLCPIVRIISLCRETGVLSGVPLRYPVGSGEHVSSKCNHQGSPFAKGCGFRSKVSCTYSLTAAMRTTTDKRVVFTNCQKKCNGYVRIGRGCKFAAVCNRLSRCCVGEKVCIEVKRVVNFINAANHDANCRLRCRIEGGGEIVRPLFIDCKTGQ